MSVSTPTGSGNAVTSVTIANGKSITVTKGNVAAAHNNDTSCVLYSTRADKLNSSCLDSSLYYKTESNGATSNKLGISFGAVSSDNDNKAVTGKEISTTLNGVVTSITNSFASKLGKTACVACNEFVIARNIYYVECLRCQGAVVSPYILFYECCPTGQGMGTSYEHTPGWVIG